MDLISVHECLVYMALKEASTWMSNRQLGDKLEDKVKPRTIRLHTKRFVDTGVAISEPAFPGYLYKFNKISPEIEQTIERMGL